MDGDRQPRGEKIAYLIAAILNLEADIVVGDRPTVAKVLLGHIALLC
jgi:hypothetical protein